MPATIIYLLNNGIEASTWTGGGFSRFYHVPSFIRARRSEQDHADKLRIGDIHVRS
jgi:hypothetical protein